MAEAADSVKEIQEAMNDGDFEAVERLATELLKADKNNASAHLALGLSLIKRNQLEAGADYLMDCGAFAAELFVHAAIAYAQAGLKEKEMRAIVLLTKFEDPRYESYFRKLAQYGLDTKNWQVVYMALKAVFETNSRDLTIVANLAVAAKELNKTEKAICYSKYAMELVGDNEQERKKYECIIAAVSKDAGYQQKAVAGFDAIFNNGEEYSSGGKLMMMQYTYGVSLSDFYQECYKFNARSIRYLPRHQHSFDKLDPERAKTGLTIGFMSGDFVAHSLANLLLEPFKRFKDVAAHHKLIIYSAREEDREDATSDVYKSSVDLWRCVHGISDEKLAQTIVDDEVDVLIDIAGFTAYNRLIAFGYKPAPVQMGWVSGMMTPPVIETINYFLTDEWIRPPCADEVCHETLINLPAAYCYFPLADAPEVNPEPAFKRNGYITFGSYNNPCKLSDEVLLAWGRCVKDVPGSHLRIKVTSRDTELWARRTIQALGIPPDRLEFQYPLAACEDLMHVYTDHTDIILDTWPCAGCLTSAEAMWMGCPVVTHYADTFLHRQTWTILNQIEHTELGADTVDGFVKAAVTLAKDTDKLEDLRNTLRFKMENAPIRQPKQMAEGVLAGVEAAWEDWCTSRKSLTELSLVD